MKDSKEDPNNNEVSNIEDNEYDEDALEDLPELERELILAKRHEEYVRRKQRSILLKNLIQKDTIKETEDSKDMKNKIINKKSGIKRKKKKNKKIIKDDDEEEEGDEEEEDAVSTNQDQRKMYTKEYREEPEDIFESSSSYSSDKDSDYNIYNKHKDKNKSISKPKKGKNEKIEASTKDKLGKRSISSFSENKKEKGEKEVKIIKYKTQIAKHDSKKYDYFKENEENQRSKPLIKYESSDRLIHLYKEEKEKKLHVYKDLSYDVIAYFQLKKTFLLDMSEHVNFSYHVIGHIIKIVDLFKLTDVTDSLTNKQSEFASKKEFIEKDKHTVSPIKNIFFITNVVHCEEYFCSDRDTDIKFEIHPLEKVKTKSFFEEIKTRMVANTRVAEKDLQRDRDMEKGMFYICDMNNICEEKLTMDEYNYIKLFYSEVVMLEAFNLFLREKIHDLKNFHFTERQIQELLKKKAKKAKKENVDDIYYSQKNIESLHISRVALQREVCSLIHQIDRLNYSKRKIAPNNSEKLEQINQEIEKLMNKKELLQNQLSEESLTSSQKKSLLELQQKEKGVDGKFVKEDSKNEPEEFENTEAKNKSSAKELYQTIEENINDFNSYLLSEISQLDDLPLSVQRKITNHYLHSILENNNDTNFTQISPETCFDPLKNTENTFEISIDKYVTTLDEIKKEYATTG